MKTVICAPAVCALLLASPAAAQMSGRTVGATSGDLPDADLAISYVRSQTDLGPEVLIRAEIWNGYGNLFHVFVCPIVEGEAVQSANEYLGAAELDGTGYGVLELAVPWTEKAEQAFRFQAVLGTTSDARRMPGVFSEDVSIDPPCEEIDFDNNPDINFDAPVSGAPIMAQWQNLGMVVGAMNANPLHPDLVLAFDSANPSVEDPDLVTPGYGPGNDTALGTLLIIAENDFDGNNDGIVDVPDDEETGGTMTFNFDEPLRLCAITLVDIDDANGTELRFFSGNTQIETIGVPNGGDNSVQTLSFDVPGVTRLDVFFGGSGGVGSLGASLCPTRVDWDQSTTGQELDMVAGQEITELTGLNITVSAQNLGGGPNKAILFDTSAPTGDDGDLAIPGYGPGNTDPAAQPAGLVLIVAENDLDANNDGNVDDPDDEGLGGVLRMAFEEPITFFSATVVDIDTYENSFFELKDQNDQTIQVLSLAPLGDNSLQTVTPPQGGTSGVWAVELHLSGSGGWVDLVYCPNSVDP